MDEGGHDEEVDRPVEDVEAEEQEGENIGGGSVETQLELGEFCLDKIVIRNNSVWS